MSQPTPQRRRIPFWGTIFTILCVFVLCTLGYWQVKRFGWKLELIAKIDATYAVDASQVPLGADDIENYSGLKRGYFDGEYSHTKSMLLQPRTHEGIAGYEVLTPFKLKNHGAQFILVNRGWIPHERERSDLFLMDVPMGDIKITGMLRRPPRPNVFTPDNDPQKGVWYRVDLNQIARFNKLDLVGHVIFYVESEEGRLKEYPLSSSNRTELNNNHAQYAFFWFSMAFFMLVVYWFRFIKKPQAT